MLTIAEFHHPDQLKPLESVWNRLYGRTPNACFSQSFESLLSHNLPPGGQLHVLLGIMNARPFGILPLKIDRRSSLRVLSGLWEPESPFAGPIGPYPTAMLIASFRHLERSRRDWDQIEICTAGDFEPLDARLKNGFRVVRWNCTIESISEPGTNATRAGFRYTHVSPWALRARWMQFRERFSGRRKFARHVRETSPCPGPHRLSLYAPATIETPDSSAP